MNQCSVSAERITSRIDILIGKHYLIHWNLVEKLSACKFIQTQNTQHYIRYSTFDYSHYGMMYNQCENGIDDEEC